MPDKEHADRADAHMGTGEGSHGTLASLLGLLDKLVEEARRVARGREAGGVGVEIVVETGEDARHNVLHADGVIE